MSDELQRDVERPGYITRDAITSQLGALETDLLLAETSQEFLKVADHLRFLGSQVEAYASRMYRLERAKAE